LSQRLEYYKDENAFELQKPMEYSFHLDSIVYIGEAHSSKSIVFPLRNGIGNFGSCLRILESFVMGKSGHFGVSFCPNLKYDYLRYTDFRFSGCLGVVVWRGL